MKKKKGKLGMFLKKDDCSPVIGNVIHPYGISDPVTCTNVITRLSTVHIPNGNGIDAVETRELIYQFESKSNGNEIIMHQICRDEDPIYDLDCVANTFNYDELNNLIRTFDNKTGHTLYMYRAFDRESGADILNTTFETPIDAINQIMAERVIRHGEDIRNRTEIDENGDPKFFF